MVPDGEAPEFFCWGELPGNRGAEGLDGLWLAEVRGLDPEPAFCPGVDAERFTGRWFGGARLPLPLPDTELFLTLPAGRPARLGLVP